MEWLLNKISNCNDRIAVNYGGVSYSYHQLSEQTEKYYHDIQNKIFPGEVISIISDYTFYSIAILLALAKNKNIVVPITSIINNEVEERIKYSYSDRSIIISKDELKIKNLINSDAKHNLIIQLQENQNSGLILFSSGITGKPKAMIHNLDVFIDSFQNKKQKNLSFLVFLMFDHIGGLNTLFNCLSMGATIVLPENRDADFVCSLIEKYKIDILPVSPTFLNLILLSESYKKYDLGSLKMITYGTEPMPESLLLRLREIFPRAKFLQTFGTSETGIAQISSKSSVSTFIKIDDPNLEYKIVDDELWLRGKTQILGYLNSSMERFTEDGWFRTGDLVETDEEGYMRIIGRNSEMINVGGQKVLPAEIESVLLQIPEIADCAVYGEKNAIIGQIVAADIVVNKQIDKKTIIDHCRKNLDAYKVPVKIKFIEKTFFNDRFKKVRGI